MKVLNRRALLTLLAGAASLRGALPAVAAALDARVRGFVDAAFAMRARAVQAGDQAYGAVVVRGDEIVGYGPSDVRGLGEWVGHAERVAMRDAQRRLGGEELSDCVMYSTSHPCSVCEGFAHKARIARMYYGRAATDAGAPRRPG
jgi:tRNA(Arg) A34 adenosine deaminase TadA